MQEVKRPILNICHYRWQVLVAFARPPRGQQSQYHPSTWQYDFRFVPVLIPLLPLSRDHICNGFNFPFTSVSLFFHKTIFQISCSSFTWVLKKAQNTVMVALSMAPGAHRFEYVISRDWHCCKALVDVVLLEDIYHRCALRIHDVHSELSVSVFLRPRIRM